MRSRFDDLRRFLKVELEPDLIVLIEDAKLPTEPFLTAVRFSRRMLFYILLMYIPLVLLIAAVGFYVPSFAPDSVPALSPQRGEVATLLVLLIAVLLVAFFLRSDLLCRIRLYARCANLATRLGVDARRSRLVAHKGRQVRKLLREYRGDRAGLKTSCLIMASDIAQMSGRTRGRRFERPYSDLPALIFSACDNPNNYGGKVYALRQIHELLKRLDEGIVPILPPRTETLETLPRGGMDKLRAVVLPFILPLAVGILVAGFARLIAK